MGTQHEELSIPLDFYCSGCMGKILTNRCSDLERWGGLFCSGVIRTAFFSCVSISKFSFLCNGNGTETVFAFPNSIISVQLNTAESRGSQQQQQQTLLGSGATIQSSRVL